MTVTMVSIARVITVIATLSDLSECCQQNRGTAKYKHAMSYMYDKIIHQ